MNLRLPSIAFACVLCFAGNANAAIMGPDFPPPGGVNWSSSGVNGTEGTAIWNYSGLDVTGLDSLYFGLNQVGYGPVGVGLDGLVAPFVFGSVSGQTAVWNGSTTYFDGTSNPPADTRLTMTVTGLGATPWVTDLASIGLDDTGTFGILGAVVDVSSGSDFVLTWKIEAKIGNGGFQPVNGSSGIQQFPGHDGDTRTNFATGFYSEATAAVPEPASLLTFSGLALGIGLGGWRKRRKQRAIC